MNLQAFFQKDPDSFDGVFEPITLEVGGSSSKSKLVLSFIKEQGSLYFVISKRHPAWTKDIGLDRVRVSDAVRKIKDTKTLPCPSMHNTDLLQQAFEGFVIDSPFMKYVKASLAQWDITPFINKLGAIAPALLTKQSGTHYEQGTIDCSV